MASFNNGGLAYQDAELPAKTSTVALPGDTERSPVVPFAMRLEALAETRTLELLVECMPERPAATLSTLYRQRRRYPWDHDDHRGRSGGSVTS